ncbi:MAG: hypothetical protein JKY56_05555 [Kofleriaceae bacterium]|nr:hypothetical protein [Kofleriaceae bacterium]
MAAAIALAGAACGDSDPIPKGVPDGDGGITEPVAYKDPLVPLNRMPGSTFVEILEVRAGDNEDVYFCSGVEGLNVVDASNPEGMRRRFQLVSALGNQRFPRCQHIALEGNLVYYTNKGDEVQPNAFISAWDLGQTPPLEIASWMPEGVTIEGIAAQGNFVYAAIHEGGLQILERVGGQLEPRGLVIGLGNAWHVAVDGDFAYVADEATLAVVDISDPSSPQIVGRTDIAGTGQSVEYDPATKRAYVSAGQSGVVIVDVSQADAPAVLGTANTGGTALQVSVDGNHLAVADWNDVRVYDMSDPANPELRATERIAGNGAFPRILGVAIRDGIVYAGEWQGFYSLRFHPDREAPDIFASVRSVAFGKVAAGEKDAIALIVGNQGTAPLVAWQLQLPSPFSLDKSAAVIAPGEVEVFEVLLEPSEDVELRKELQIWSDDPDDKPLVLPLTANRPGFVVGDKPPDVIAALLDGGTWNLSEQKGKVVLLAYFATF